MSAPPRRVIDVSHLPEVVFGPKGLTWWGTVAFMVIEGTTLAVCAVSYLYLRQNFPVWPPSHTPLPELLIPTINTILLLLVIVPLAYAGRAAKRLDLHRVRRGLVIGTALTTVALVLRAFEFTALGLRWDDNAYGSAAWTVLGFHTALLVVDLLETGALSVLFHVGPLEEKHFADAEDAALYQYFLSVSYVPLYVLVFLSPRWL